MKVCACFLRNFGKLWTIILYSYNLMSNCTLCYTIWTNPPPKSMVYLSVLKPAVLCADSWMHVAESQCSSEAPHALLSEATEEEPAVYRCFFVIRIKCTVRSLKLTLTMSSSSSSSFWNNSSLKPLLVLSNNERKVYYTITLSPSYLFPLIWCFNTVIHKFNVRYTIIRKFL